MMINLFSYSVRLLELQRFRKMKKAASRVTPNIRSIFFGGNRKFQKLHNNNPTLGARWDYRVLNLENTYCWGSRKSRGGPLRPAEKK